MRKSSRGNPYHDERGRFTTSDGCKIRSERTAEEYAARSSSKLGDAKKAMKERMTTTSDVKERAELKDEYRRTFYFNGDINEGLRSEVELYEESERALRDGVRPAPYHAQVKRQVNDEVTVQNLGGYAVKGKIVAIQKDYEGNDVYVVESKLGKGLYDGNVLDNWMTSDEISRDKTNADRIRANNMHRYAKDEVLFSGINYSRCHAAIVDELPKKTSRWANGYAELAKYEHKGKVYTVYKDRDDHGQFSYFAIES